ncbi:MAG TPA: sigma-70 family RNA polymerase sigma factor [Pyrinomonadaceae bacterium]|jgi:RNA polymerase sigma-70 factor (ECF subfamily)|nr:sigma-70 family RNA polymerase sigma factor [Pyrinomonadaceae bacterium]
MPETGSEVLDEVLVVAAIVGDLGAFDQLVARYRAAVVRTAQTFVGRDDAEDVAQDVLLLAFKALPSIDEPSKFAAWLSAITRHHAMRYNRRERAHQRGRIELDEMLLAQFGALTKPLVDSSGDEELRLALEHIPADYSVVLHLRFLDEMPLKRIAAFTGMPVSTVKWRLHHGKKLLREQVERLRIGSTLPTEHKATEESKGKKTSP